jgi:hypothetical protein
VITLGRLTKVELRDIWKSESQDFTPWLAQPENITALAEALSMELEIEAREREVGPFRADLLCKDLIDDSWVLIENQLERTDHSHLGQLLTYAAGLQTVTIVWIASRFTEEHRAALDWLNEITDERFKFFGVEVELWRIGDSVAAPKFNIVSKPNEWTRSITQASRQIESEALTETKKLQLDFWVALQKALEGHAFLRSRKPRPQHWTTYSIGRTGMHLGAILDSQKSRIAVELYLGDENAKAFFAQLKAEQGAIEAELGHAPAWMELPSRRACRIVRYKNVTDPFDETSWPELTGWISKTLESYHHAFQKRVQKLEAPAASGDVAGYEAGTGNDA